MLQGISTRNNGASSHAHLSVRATGLEPSTMLNDARTGFPVPQICANYFPEIEAGFPTDPRPDLGGFLQSYQSLTLGGSEDYQSPAVAPVVLGKGKRTSTPPVKAQPQRRSRKRKGQDKRCKKTSLALTREQHFAIHAGWEHARLIGLPLNWMLTIRPDGIDLLSPEERRQLWENTYKRIEQYFRDKERARKRKDPHCLDKELTFAAAWSRESKRVGKRDNGAGEHWHILLHLPAGLKDHFEQTMRRKFRGRHEIDLSPRHQLTYWKKHKRYNAASYICKAANPRLVRADPSIPYRPSGPIFGCRAGVTRNIGSTAIEAYEAHRRRLNGSVLPDASRSKLAA